jgi:hypothetical protein
MGSQGGHDHSAAASRARESRSGKKARAGMNAGTVGRQYQYRPGFSRGSAGGTEGGGKKIVQFFTGQIAIGAALGYVEPFFLHFQESLETSVFGSALFNGRLPAREGFAAGSVIQNYLP